MNCLKLNKLLFPVFFILALLLGNCGGSGSSSSGGQGTYLIDMTGGDSWGTAGAGGNQFRLAKSGGQGNVEILSTGRAEPDFIPQSFDPGDAFLGANAWQAPVGISTIVVAGGFYIPVNNEPYLLPSDDNLYIANNTADLTDDPIVTGIYIPTGSTVVPGANSSLLGYPVTKIILTNDFYLAGTLKTEVGITAVNTDLDLGCNNFYSTGSIDTSGINDAQGGGDVSVQAAGNILNYGPITTSGASSTFLDGGDAGQISLTSATGSIENVGVLKAVGGDVGDVGLPGAGGTISFLSSSDVRNAADIDARGGAGRAAGGDGGFLGVNAAMSGTGDFLSEGNINLSGGMSTVVSGSGGDGGDIMVSVFGGQIILSGNIDLSGADANLANSVGGNGGDLSLWSNPTMTVPTVMAGSIVVSGNLDLSGGSTAAGASGGFAGGIWAEILVENSAAGDASTASISFLGYRDIDLSGGDGTVGGNGGNVSLINGLNPGALSGGELISGVNFDAVGGRGEFMGGNGGNVVIDSMTSASNSAVISTDGGNADLLMVGTMGGNGGNISVIVLDGFINTGTFSFWGGEGDIAGFDGILTLP